MSAGTVLLVEDNPITRKMLRVTLELEGYHVLDSEDGKTALTLVAARRPDLLILDYVLPDIDGLQLLAELRRRIGGSEVPAVIITGMVSRLDDLRGRAGTATHMLAKPVEPSQLLELVRAQLAPAAVRATGQRVLVIDDEPLNLKLAAFRLKRAGYEVITASGGEEALALARQRRPDAILSDVMMPAIDGFTFCREARRESALASIPIVLVSSAYVDEADRELARQMGANALVVRTPDLREAIAALEAGLAGATGQPPTATSAAAAVLHRERLQVQLERQATRNETLLRQAAIQATALSVIRGLSEVLVEPRDVQQVLGDVLVHCLDAAGLSTGLLYMVEPGAKHRLAAQFGVPAERKPDAEMLFGHPQLISRIAESGQPFALSANGEVADAESRDFLARVGHSSVLVMPLVVLGEAYGELVLASDDHDLADSSWNGFARSLALQFGQTVALGQSLKRLAASESRYRALMENANDAILILDSSALVLEVNLETERLLGRGRDQIIGRHYEEFVVPDERTDSARLQEQLLVDRALRIESRQMVRADGRRVSVEVSASLIEVGDEVVGLTILRDITDRKEAELKLQESEEQYRLLFDHNPLPMWVFDVESLAFLAVNDAAVRHYGWTREEFLGMRLTDIRPAEGVSTLMADIAALRQDPGRYERGVWRHRKKDRTEIDVEITASSITFHGRSARLTMAADVTERTTLQAQLLRAQKMEAVGQLAGGVAHDFNNLLGVITGYSELLIRDARPDARERKRGEEIKAAADRAAALTRQLLAFSRRQMLQPTVLDLGSVVAGVERMLRRLISEDIQIVTKSVPDLGRVRADAGQLEQVIMNLAVNARDAMPSGGRLLIETANVELDQTYTRIRPDARPGDYVMLAVSDTGHGIDSETVAHIFEPFFTTKEEGKGTGLGLATVYGIVRQSGGLIEVYSEPGMGTRFQVYLPRVEAAVETNRRVELAQPPGGTETILVVEDAGALRKLVRELLESAGYTVLDAEAPDKALAIVESRPGPLHLILTDMVMPQMSGQDLAARIGTLKPEAKLVFMSGYSEQGLGHHATLTPGTNFLQKPFTMDVLLRTIRRALDA